MELNGNSSSDADGDALSYSWQQTAGPTVALQSANSAVASFTAPSLNNDTQLVFELTVSDGNGGSASAGVTVTVQKAAGNTASGGGGGGGGALLWLLALVAGLGRVRRWN